ncbi:VOC family protein [Puniceicoccaceae bacterium K14]|nr:VOC family protein [Puniceicoccaceae bacterium K14]
MSEESNKEDKSPGLLPWTEIVTNDKESSVKFYTELFGWSTDVMPMPNGQEYTVFKKGDRPVAGCVVPPTEEGAMPMWLSYVTVEDIDASIAKLEALGGKVFKGRVDIPMGSFAVVAGPEGAVFAFWQYGEEG